MLSSDNSDITISPAPSLWSSVPLERLVETRNGLWKGKKAPFRSARVIRNTNFNNDGTLDLSDVAELNVQMNQFESRQLLRGDIILERSGGGPSQPVGRVIYFDLDETDFSFSNFTTRLRVENPDIKPKFLLYYLLHFYRKGYTNALQSRTTGIRNLSFTDYKQIQVPLPPISEQQVIISVLSTVQESIEATAQVIAATRELKRSLLKYLFTYGPVPISEAENVLLKETVIGDVPKDWDVKSLGNIEEGEGSIQTGPFGSLLHASDYVPSGIPSVMPKDLSEDARIVTDTIAYIGEKDFKRIEKYHLQTGDVITARRGEIGRRALVTENEDGWVCGTGCLRIRSGKLLFPTYLSHALETPKLRSWLLDHCVGSTMPNLSSRILKQLPFPFPEYSIQEDIAELLRIVESKTSVETRCRSALEALFDSLLYNLMTGMIRVQI